MDRGSIIIPYRAEYVSDDSFLPGQQLEGLAMEFTLGMLQTLDELCHPASLCFTEHPASPL